MWKGQQQQLVYSIISYGSNWKGWRGRARGGSVTMKTPYSFALVPTTPSHADTQQSQTHSSKPDTWQSQTLNQQSQTNLIGISSKWVSNLLLQQLIRTSAYIYFISPTLPPHSISLLSPQPTSNFESANSCRPPVAEIHPHKLVPVPLRALQRSRVTMNRVGQLLHASSVEYNQLNKLS